MNDLELTIAKAITDGKILVPPSLKSFAIVLNVKPIQIYTVAKTPIKDVIYDARVFNWDAIAKYCVRRFDPDAGVKDYSDLVEKAIQADLDLTTTDRRTKTSAEKVLLNGKSLPARKSHVQLLSLVKLKKDTIEYHVVYITDTHIVLQFGNTSEITCLSNWTYNNRVESVIL